MIFLVLVSTLAWGDVVIPPVHAPTLNIEKTPPQPPPKPKYTGPIFLDARSAFDYAMGHMPMAISIRWQDYSQTEPPHKGELDPDLDLLARKLRFLGINPGREVIILGLGDKGAGEEGRIGWMLNYLGIKKVKIENIASMSGQKTLEDKAQYESVAPWNPKPVSYLRIRLADLRSVLGKKDFAIVDVRDETDFARHIPGAINIPWKNFLGKTGEPLGADQVKALLEANRIAPQQTVEFYSDDGISSAYATFVCTQAGLRAGNYDGGFQEWVSISQDPVQTLQKDQDEGKPQDGK